MDGAAGLLPALCQGAGGQHQLGTYPMGPHKAHVLVPLSSSAIFCHHVHLSLFSLSYLCIVTCAVNMSLSVYSSPPSLSSPPSS